MEKQSPPQKARKNTYIIVLCLCLITAVGFLMSHNCGMGFALSRSEPQDEFQASDSLGKRHRVLTEADLAGFKSEVEDFETNKRDDKNDDKNDNNDKKKKKNKSILDQTFMRVIIGCGVFAIFNVAVITIHHIVLKVGSNAGQYREMEHVYSPF